ncbi:TPA: hypothetical protein J4Z76_001307 [Escherichia coli]|nr:hypothetical protein [Escherichia coli]HCQ0091571.1 hypothetical protein [Escherichia coli]
MDMLFSMLFLCFLMLVILVTGGAIYVVFEALCCPSEDVREPVACTEMKKSVGEQNPA